MYAALGSLLANRFEIEHAIGSGGMGTVYRARDRFSGEWVAVKLMRSTAVSAGDAERFTAEAQLLSELRHPGIVTYVAHGHTLDGQLYLAMEWLTGEDLSRRLRLGALSIADCRTMLIRTASALALAHERGIIHRDIKPANLFLSMGQFDRLKLLDFGVARQRSRSAGVTGTGVVVGTPEYMAPEQVRGQRDLGPAADIFSLGCVLYECLTGQPPFSGEHIPAVLMRILFEEPAAVGSRRSGVPEAMATLLGRMLAKDPAARPPDATTLLAELERLPTTLDGSAVALSRDGAAARPVLDSDQQLMCVLLVESALAADTDLMTGETLPSGGHFSTARYQQAAEVLKEFGARSDWLMTGELVATLGGVHDATDLTAKAARCSLSLAKVFEGARIVLSTGRGNATRAMPIGEVIDRAAAMLRGKSAAESQELESEFDPAGSIRVDELSARLLERRFTIIRRGEGYRLVGELTVDEARPLLGKPTACVGRESELGILESLWNGCAEETEARAILITASPGVGKSRLRQEFLRRLRAKGGTFTLLEGRAELMSSGSTYDVIARALRRLCEISGAEPLAEQQRKLAARVHLHSPSPGADRTAAFLGELCGIPFSDANDPVLAAARQDPEVMRGHIQQSFLNLLRGEGAAAPVLLIFDDLHWADALSVRLIDHLLQSVADTPLLVMMLARPEVHEQYAAVWQKRKITQLALKELNRKACERLIRQVLGVVAPAEVVAKIWQRSGGHALFLEESLRAFVEGDTGDRADTVIAMLQARLGRLPSLARRVIRAASVFGETFWRGGVAAVLEQQEQVQDLDHGLEELVAAEFVEKNSESRLALDLEYRFRHALIREAAYGLLLPEDLRAGHRQAGSYLLSAGESDPLPIAEHLEQGGVPAEAVRFYIQAGELSLRRGDLTGALDLSVRADRCGPKDELLGQLRAIQASVYSYTLDRDAQARTSQEALALLRPGSQRWSKAGQFFVAAESARGNMHVVRDWVHRLPEVLPEADAISDYQWMMSTALWSLCSNGDFALGRRLFEYAHSLQQIFPSAWVASRMILAESQYLRFVDPDPWQQVEGLREALAHSERAETLDYIIIAADFLGESQGELGDFSAGEATLRKSVEWAVQSKQEYLMMHARLHLCELLAKSPQRAHLEEAAEIARTALSAIKLSVGFREWAHGLLARACLNMGDPGVAERELRQALELRALSPLRRLLIEATFIECLLALGRATEAAAKLGRSLQKLETLGSAGYAEIPLRLAAAETLLAIGDRNGAAGQLGLARREIERRAQKIPDAAARERYLTQIPEHAQMWRALDRVG